MKRRSFIVLTVLAGAVICGLLLIDNLGVNSSKPAAPETGSITAADLQAASAGIHQAERGPRDRRSLLPEPFLWHDRLLTLQAETNELFGASGEERMKELQTFVEGLSVADLPNA